MGGGGGGGARISHFFYYESKFRIFFFFFFFWGGGGGGERELRWGAKVSDFLLRIQIENKKYGWWEGGRGSGMGGLEEVSFFYYESKLKYFLGRGEGWG